MTAQPILPEMVSVAAGAFRMGDDGGRPDERPARRVWVDAFRVARTPVTNAEYARFLGATGCAPPRFWSDPRFNHPQQPVVGVRWGDALAYCAWLSAHGGESYRLPTEAEWERAARGGRDGETYPWGDDPAGWAADPADARVRHEQPNRVGRSVPNGYGLLDMGYNVHEWCSDWYASGYYADAPAENPHGPRDGVRRASRGGAWRHQVQVCRTSARSSLVPTYEYNDYSFRVFGIATGE